MVRPQTDVEATPQLEPVDRDERLGAAIEEYLALAESGSAPEPEVFAAKYPDLTEDLLAGLDGLAMVRGLVGDSGSGPGSRLEAGRRVAGYRIVRELGRGGMGIVYEAVHVDLDRPVALKVLNTHAAPDSSGRRRFLNEAKTAAGLHHTHIVPVFDVGQVGGLCYYAMQRIEGSGLDRVVKSLRKGRSTAAGSGSNKAIHTLPAFDLPDATSIGDPTRSWFGASTSKPNGSTERVDEPPLFEPPRGSEYYRWVARAGAQAAEALAHAHRRGVIHRDVKPSNLLVDARGTVWVADFGLARRLADPAITQTDSLLGTPRYMSPEQTELGPVDGRTDLYSLGTTLYELLTLRPPFDGKSAAELVVQIRDKEPAPPRKLDPKLPRDLETIIMKAMAKRPSDRYAGPAELAEDLQRFLAMEPVKARRIGPVGRAWRFARRHPSLTAVSTIATVAILGTATLSHMKILKERNEAVTARNKTQETLGKLEVAQQDMRKAMRKNLWREATAVRQSSLPDRRKTSLARLQDAVKLGPDDETTPLLRDEAVQILGQRDVQPRPSLPTGSVRRVAFVTGTDRLATLSEAGDLVDLWDLNRNERTARHLLPDGRGDGRTESRSRGPRTGASTFTAASSYVAVAVAGGEGVRVFDPTTEAKFKELDMPGRIVSTLAATPDGKRLVVMSFPKGGGPPGAKGPVEPVISLWDMEQSWKSIATFTETEATADSTEVPSQFRRASLLIACSPDSQTIAMTWFGPSARISLWNASDGKRIGTIDTDAFTSSIALSNDGVLAAASGGSILRWDARTMRPLPGLSLHLPFPRQIRFSPDGTMLAVSSMINGIEIWDPEANTLLASVPTSDSVHDIAFSPNGRSLVAAANNETRVWEMVEPIGRMRLAAPETRPPSHLTHLSFSPSGAVATSFWNGKALSARVQCPDGGVSTHDNQRTEVVGFDPLGRVIVLSRQHMELYRSARDTSPELRVALPEMPPYAFMPSRSDQPRSDQPKSVQDLPAITSWSRSADGRALIVIRHEDTLLIRFDDDDRPQVTSLKITNASDNRLRPERRGRGPGGPSEEGRNRGPGSGGPRPEMRGRPDGEPRRLPSGDHRSLVISASGDRFYLLGDRGELRGWSIEGDQATQIDLGRVPTEIIRMATSPDGQLLALGRQTGEVVLVKTTNAEVVATIPATEGAGIVTAVAFSPKGELAVGFQSGLVRLWATSNISRPQPLVALPGQQSIVTSLAYGPNGQRLAVGDASGADVWDLDSVRQQLKAIGLGW